jgi:hypothetical protein
MTTSMWGGVYGYRGVDVRHYDRIPARFLPPAVGDQGQDAVVSIDLLRQEPARFRQRARNSCA